MIVRVLHMNSRGEVARLRAAQFNARANTRTRKNTHMHTTRQVNPGEGAGGKQLRGHVRYAGATKKRSHWHPLRHHQRPARRELLPDV